MSEVGKKEWMTPQDKWQQKAGYMTKGFKIKRAVAEEFAQACDKAGVSQASQITKMMKDFIEQKR